MSDFTDRQRAELRASIERTIAVKRQARRIGYATTALLLTLAAEVVGYALGWWHGSLIIGAVYAGIVWLVVCLLITARGA